jgi:hypothetical protein
MDETPQEPAVEPESQPQEPAERPVLSWKGDASVFNSGIPNRDIYPADGLSDELTELAISSGTHERP